MTDALKRRLVWLTLIGAILFVPVFWLAYRPTGGWSDLHGYVLGRDFVNMWVGPKVAESFGTDVLFDPGAYHKAMAMILGTEVTFHNWSYPPDVLLLAWPFSALPYALALAAWTLLGLAVYLVAVAAGLPRADRNWGLLFAALAPASLVNLAGGQNGFYTAALMLGAILLLERRPWLAGILVGLLTMKPHLGLLFAVMLIATGAWRAMAAAMATAVLLFAVSVAIWGLEPWETYFTHTTSFVFATLVLGEGFLSFMQLSPLAALRAFVVPLSAALAVQALVTILVVAVTAIAVRRAGNTPLRALLVASGTFLASPYAFNDDLPVLTGAILWTMGQRPFGVRETWLLGAAFVLAPAQYALHAMHLDVAPLIFAGVFCVAAREILSPKEGRTVMTPAPAGRH